MAVKFVNVRQEGDFHYNGKHYKVVIEKKSTAELYNFYGKDDMVMCSVLTKYLSKAVGVKKAGEYEREVYGNFEIYMNFVSVLEEVRHLTNEKLETDRKLIMDDLGGFVDSITRKNKTYYHKQNILSGNILTENIQKLDEDTNEEVYSINYDSTSTGKAVKAMKIKGLEYSLRESGNSDIKKVQVKTLDMIALEKDLTWVESKRYRLLKTKEDFDEYVDRIDKHTSEIGFDTETTGLRINRFPVGHPKRDRLVGICLSLEDNEGVYIPIYHKLFENIDEEYVIEKLRQYIDMESNKKKSLVTHYGSFDWKVMYTYGIDLNIENDTYILQYILNNSEFRGKKTLSSLAYAELGMDMIDLPDMFIKTRGRKLDIDFSMLTEEPVRHYAPADSDATRMLFKKKIEELLPSMQFLYWVEVELMKYIAHMEYHGMKLDIDLLVELIEKAKEDKDRLEKEMLEIVGREFNPNSPKDLAKVMYEELGYPILHYTDSGGPSTGKHALSLLSNIKEEKTGKDKYTLASVLSSYKKQEKLINGFLNKMLTENTDGFIFPHYNQTGTDSGRISCSGPKGDWAVA